MTAFTRREFTKLALAAVPAAGAMSMLARLNAAEPGAPSKKVNSKVNGVMIGLNVPYSFGMGNAMPAEEVLERTVQLGISGLELRTQPVELFMGVPPNLVGARASVAQGGNAKSIAEQLRDWRLKADPKRAAELRKKYNDAGVHIEIVKVDNLFRLADAELDYVFNLAKALGARAISTEISRGESSDADHARIGKFADKHRLMVGLHGHTHTGPADWEKAFSFSKYLGANLDIGHFVAGLAESPVPFLKQHHDRITHVHVKDRKKHEGNADGPNMPFGEGDTPIVEVLRLIRDNRWNIQATIEFEYKVPAGSDRMTEIAKCVKYCRDALA